MYQIFTDGACDNSNTKQGSWSYVVYFKDQEEHHCFGTEEKTTNNRMEYKGILNALTYIQEKKIKHNVHIFSDSQYCVDSLTKWAFKWKRKNWYLKQNQLAKNLDLLQPAFELLHSLDNVALNWVKGHCGIRGNERADDLCNIALGKGPGFKFDYKPKSNLITRPINYIKPIPQEPKIQQLEFSPKIILRKNI